jgi:hypothetical protein
MQVSQATIMQLSSDCYPANKLRLLLCNKLTPVIMQVSQATIMQQSSDCYPANKLRLLLCK